MSLGRLRLRRPNQFRSGGGLLAAGITAAWLIGAGSAFAQPAPQEKPLLAEQVFKNIRALKGIPVDDFMETMGLMSAALSFDCSDCHAGAGTDKVDWAADTPRKVTARMMVNMVATINKNNFRGRQEVTCWTCHRNRDKPLVTPTRSNHIRQPTLVPDDVVTSTPGLPLRESILDKYIQASGGAQRLAGLTSIDAKGTSVGFGGFGGGGAVEIVAKAPDKRATIILFKAETGRGDQIRTYDGKHRLGANAAQCVRGISVERRRSGRRQVRRAVVFSRPDQADSHEFENRPADHDHRSSSVAKPSRRAEG